MPRVIGIDPGTVSIDLCGLDNGRLFLDRSWPTAEALADPAPFVAELEAAGPRDLVVGPSGPARSNVSLVLLDRGGAFTAVLAGAAGRIVDGVGGSAGPLGFRAAGALDGEVAYLAGEVPKALLFRGGAASIAGWDETTASPERLAHPTTPAEQVARDALVESAVKTTVAPAAQGPSPKAFGLSG